MADSRTIQINLKAVSDFNDVVSNAKQIQNALNKLKIPDNLRANFTKIFGDIEKYSEKAAQSMANGFKTKGDVSSFEKSVNGVNASFERLIQTVAKIDKEGLGFGSYEGQIKQLEVEIQGLNKQLGEMASKYSKAVNEVTKPASSKSGAWEEFKQAFNIQDVEAMEKALKRLEQARSRATEKNKGSYDESLEIFRKALAAVKGEGPEAAKIIEEINKKLAQQNNFKVEGLKETTGNLEEASTATRDLSEQQFRLGKSSVESAQSMQQVNSELDHFKSRIAYFFGAQNAVNLFKRALRSAFETVKDLDKVMTETAVVTKFDVSDMWKQLPEYTKRANELGVTIHSAYEAATIYYQQGLETNQVMEVSNQTLKMARIAGLDAAEATDRMTNALRGFNMEINEMNATRVADVYSKLAAMSASNVDEISTAMTKVASLASNANMEFETTAAFLAQVIETTRESAETAGTALKTVIARFSEVKKLYSTGELLGTDEEGEAIDVNKVSKALRTAGVDLNEYLTGMKGLDDIFIELASKWDNLDQIQQRYIATMAAGSRQQSRFIAMMQDYGRTQQLVSAAENASGASQEQYQKTLESLETKLNKLKNAWNEFIMGIANNQIIKGAVDLLTNFITAINKLTSSLPGVLSGLAKLALAFGAFKIGKNVFNQGLAKAGQVLRTGLDKTTGEVSKDAVKSGNKIGTSLKDGISKELSNFKGAGNPFKGAIKNAIAEANAEIKGSEIKKSIEKNIAAALNTGTFKGEDPAGAADAIYNAFQTGGIEAAIEAAQRYGVALDDIKAKIQEIIAAKADFEFKNISTTLITTGSSIMMLTSLLGRLGIMGDKTTKIFSSMGATMMAAGILMKLFGDSAMAAGIKAFIAGKLGELGWMWITWIFTAVAAIIGLIIGLASNIETAEKRMQRLENEAKKAAEAATDVANKYQELEDTLIELGDQENALKKMTAGTVEWTTAVMNLNQKVLELIDKFPELAEYITSDNGILNFTEEGITKVEEAYRRLVYQAQAASAAANLEVHQQKQSDAKNTATSMIVGSTPTYGLLPEEKALAEKVASALGGNQESIEELNEQLKNSGTNFEEILENNTGIDRANAIFEALGQQMFLAGGNDQYEEFVNAGKEFNLGELSDPGYYKSIIAPVLTEMTGELGKEQIEIFSGILDADKINEIIESNAEDVKIDKAYRDFFKKLYGDDITFKRGAIEQNGEQLLSAAAAKKQYVAGNLDKYAIEVAQQEYDKIRNVKDNELKQALIEFYKNGQESVSKNTADYLVKNIDKVFEVVGPEVANQMKLVAEQSQISFNDIIGNFVRGTNKSSALSGSAEANRFGENVLQNVSTEALESYFNNLSTIYGQYGEAAATKFSDSFHNILDDRTLEQQKEIVELAKKYDFTKYVDIKDFSKELKELGYNIPDNELNALTNEFTKLTGITREFSLSTLSNQFKDILSLSKDISDREELEGLTPEEYEKLIGILPDLADSFVFDGENFLYLDGTMADLAYAIRENTAAILGKTAGQLQEQVDLGNEVAAAIEKANLKNKYNKVSKEDLEAGTVSNIEAIKSFMEDLYGKNYVNKFDDANLLADYQEKMMAYNNRVQNQAEIDQFNAQSAASTAYQRLINTNAQDMTSGNYTVFGDEQAKGLMTPQALEEYDALLEKTVNSTSNLKARSEELADVFKEMDMSSEDATRTGRELAIQYDKLERGIDDVRKAVGDELEVLNDSTSTAAELGDSYQNIAAVASKVFGKGVTADFVEEYKEQFKELEQGVPGAFEAICDALNEKNAQTWADIYNQTHDSAVAVENIIAALDGISFNAYGYADFSEVERAAQVAGMEVIDFIKILEEASGITLSYDPGWMAQLASAYEMLAAAQASGDPRGLSFATRNLANVKGNVGKFTVTRGGSGYNPTGHGGYTPKGGSGGGGGGGGKEEKPTYWENPYDELYNLTEKINEALRERERLERRYQKIAKLGTTTAGEMRQAFTDQIEQLEREIDLQKQLEAGRLRQIKNIGNQIYTDSEGNRSTFSQLGVTKYANYNEKTGLIQIDWNAIEAVSRDPNRSEEGEAIEAYISRLEELVEGYEEIRDTIWDMQDEIEDLIQEAIDSYLDFEDRVFNALVEERQKEIDSFEKISDAIDDATGRVLDKMEKQIEQERQNRENDKTEEEIADKEARLAYLSRDTSGANAMEIMQLQEELEEARQNYTDSLIDQAIQQMRDDADLAAEQRAEQQAVMEAQLEIEKTNGSIMQQAVDLIHEANTALGSEYLMQVLRDSDGYKNMSEIGKAKWTNDFVTQWNKAQSAYDALQKQEAAQAASAAGTASGTTSTNSNSSASSNNSAPKSKYPLTLTDDIAKGVATSICLTGGSGWGNGQDRINRITEKFGAGAYDKIQGYVDQIAWSGWKNLYSKNGANYTYYAFKKGGLANFTGPAWLDGTRSNPEMVLNAKDTENFIQLKDLLSHIVRGDGTSSLMGDNYYNFEIQANLADDYDVDQMVERLKYLIVQESNYRNVNAINLTR